MPATSQSLTGLARVTGILAAAVLLSALFWIGTAVAATNTAYGELALSSDTSGTDNSAFGYRSPLVQHHRHWQYRRWIQNVDVPKHSGKDNTAVGFFALTDNTSGEGSTAVGFNALANQQH